MSFAEIYNEKVGDLLAPDGRQLPIRHSQAQGFYIEGATVVDCTSMDDANAVLEEGLRNRTRMAHAMNADMFFLTFMLTFGEFLANFERLVLGCIETNLCK